MAKELIEPKIKGFICTTAHPLGCEESVRRQINVTEKMGPIEGGPKRALIIGASTGYGLASRIALAFGAGTDTVGVFYERPAEGSRTASAGWYNSVAFSKFAREKNLKFFHINGDAFSDEIKRKTIETIRAHLKQVDLVVYSLAAPRRTNPKTGEVYRSALKPIGAPFTAKTVNTDRAIIHEITLEPATDEEIRGTVNVMGGNDWQLWMEALLEAGVLSHGCKTVAYSYIGPQLTWPIYRDGTIGRAKADLDRTANELQKLLAPIGGEARIAINKAVVTQASSAIPVVPLYISLLFKVMKEKNLHEDCILQMNRLFRKRVYAKAPVPGLIDSAGRWRVDDWEMRPDVQLAVENLWPVVNTENFYALSDFAGYKSDFLYLFGFGGAVDGRSPVEVDRPLEVI